MNYLEKLCEDLGEIKKFRKDDQVFGNIELEIETPRKTLLSIVSDRGEFSCYVFKKTFLYSKSVPIGNIIKTDRDISFHSLESIINYLKNNLEIIEKG